MNPNDLTALIGRLLAADKYYFDVGNALPDSLGDAAGQEAYLKVVAEALYPLNPAITAANGERIVAAITGMLLLMGHTQPDAAGFEANIRRSWEKLYAKERGNDDRNNDIFVAVEAKLRADRAAGDPVSFQELAYAGDALCTGENRVKPNNANFAGVVRVAAQEYLEQRTPFGGLGELPPLSGDSADDTEILPENIRSVAWIYAGYQYEQIRLFDVVDRMAELFMNGLLPIGLDDGGRALDRYYWDSEDRLSAAARYSHYSRVLGAAGGQVSREVQPNTEFNNRWLNFLASVAEFDRQQRVADLMAQSRGLGTTGEHVRKAGRDLAANVSLYGWAATHFIAKRLETQIQTVIGILRLPSIQKAYAVQSPWQVIERVTAAEFGQVPNIVRHDTMARSGKKILDLVAKHHTAWGSTRGRPLFTTNDNGLAALLTASVVNAAARNRMAQLQVQQGADIPLDDQNALFNETQYWLAVNGITDAEVDKRAQPAVSSHAPSIPSTGGGANGSGNVDQLRQMISQGQMPSMDQLQQLVGVNGAAH